MDGLMNQVAPIPRPGMTKTVPQRPRTAMPQKPMPPPAPPASAAPAPPAGPQGAPGAPPAPQPASPQEQAAYEQFVKNGLAIIYDKDTTQSLLKTLDGGGNPIVGLVTTLASIVSRLIQSATKAGKPPSPAVILHGAGELLAALADLSKESGGHAYSPQELQQVAEGMVKGVTQPQQQQGPPQGAPPGGPQAAPPQGPPAQDDQGQPGGLLNQG